MPNYFTTVMDDTPQLYYRLGESSGTSATDSSGNGYTGTYAGSGITLGQTGAIKDSTDTAVKFTGNSGANVAVSSSLSPTGWTTLSVEYWVNISAYTSGNPNIVADTYYGSNIGFFMGQISNGTTYFQIGNGTTYNTASNNSSVLSTGTWYHICGTWDGSTIRVYVNGSLDSSNTASLTGSVGNPGSGNNITIGFNSNYSGSYGTFTVDEVAIYHSTLSQSRVTAHYNAGIATLAYRPVSDGMGGMYV